ncbi:MAG: hypothetical protein RL536_268 [Candidatus Parcubacteria bacterium]
MLESRHPSHKKALITVLVCVIVVSLVYVFCAVFGPNTWNDTAPVSTITTQKQALIERIDNVGAKPLTVQERIEMINFVSTGGATYSEAEKEMITKALRAK